MNTAYFKENSADYIGGDLEILSRLRPDYDLIVMLSGWSESEGAIAERTAAIKHGLKVKCEQQELIC